MDSESQSNFLVSVENLKKEIGRLESGFNKVKSDLDSCLSLTKSEIKSEINSLIAHLESFTAKIKLCDEKLDYFERRHYSSAMVITGIPFAANDSVENIFTKISAAVEFERGIEAVDVIYWMKSRKISSRELISKSQTSIFVRFISHRLKMMFFKQYITPKNLSLRHIGLDIDNRIYCNHYLSKVDYSILQAALKVKRIDKNIISKISTKTGLVNITFTNNNKVFIPRSIEEFHNINRQFQTADDHRTVSCNLQDKGYEQVNDKFTAPITRSQNKKNNNNNDTYVSK